MKLKEIERIGLQVFEAPFGEARQVFFAVTVCAVRLETPTRFGGEDELFVRALASKPR